MSSREELTTANAFKQQFDSLSLLLRTTMPAQVVAWYPDKNTVDVQPVLQGAYLTDDGEVVDPYNLPIINDVQVQFFGAGDFWLTVEPTIGSYCVLSISDRCIEGWKKAGGIINPQKLRHHDKSDAFAYMGLNPLTDAIPSVESGTLHMRSRDGLTGIKLTQDAIDYDVGGVNVCTMTSSLVEFKVPIKTPEATINNIPHSTHKHTQAADSAGNSQEKTNGPTT
tara:strand:- start:1982 stop:2653 length:672 start_codon:yes stop_codon:yes gene_type:complete